MNPTPTKSLADIFSNPTAQGKPSLQQIFNPPTTEPTNSYTHTYNPSITGVPDVTEQKDSTVSSRFTDAFKNYGNILNKAGGALVSPFTQVGKGIYDVTTGNEYTKTIEGLYKQNNAILDYLQKNGIKKGDPRYDKMMKLVKDNLTMANNLRSESTDSRAGLDFTGGLANDDIINALDKGDYGRAFMHASTGGASATAGAVFSPLALPAQAVFGTEGPVGRAVSGAVTGAALGGPAGAVVGGLFGLLPDLENKIKENPLVAAHLAEHPEDEKIFNDVLGLSLTVLGTRLSNKTAPAGKPGILNTPISQVPGRVGTNLYNTALAPVKLAQPIVQHVADSLEKENLRLTPVQKANFGKKIENVVHFNEKNNVTGNPGQRLNKINQIVNGKEKEFQAFLKTGQAKDITIPKDKIISELEALKKHYMEGNEYDATGAVAKIDKAINRFGLYKTDKIAIADVNELKRSTYESSYDAASRVRDPVLKNVSTLLKDNVETATDGLKLNGVSLAEFNRDYGSALTSQTLIEAAVGRNQLGLIGNLAAKTVGGAIGTGLGGPGGGVAGLILGDKIANILVGTSVRSHIASLLSKVSGGNSSPSSLSNSVSATANKNINSKDIGTNSATKKGSTQSLNTLEKTTKNTNPITSKIPRTTSTVPKVNTLPKKSGNMEIDTILPNVYDNVKSVTVGGVYGDIKILRASPKFPSVLEHVKTDAIQALTNAGIPIPSALSKMTVTIKNVNTILGIVEQAILKFTKRI